jgi:hypothetical protein
MKTLPNSFGKNQVREYSIQKICTFINQLDRHLRLLRELDDMKYLLNSSHLLLEKSHTAEMIVGVFEKNYHKILFLKESLFLEIVV